MESLGSSMDNTVKMKFRDSSPKLICDSYYDGIAGVKKKTTLG
jgi:hypothetical protein